MSINKCMRGSFTNSPGCSVECKIILSVHFFYRNTPHLILVLKLKIHCHLHCFRTSEERQKHTMCMGKSGYVYVFGGEVVSSYDKSLKQENLVELVKPTNGSCITWGTLELSGGGNLRCLCEGDNVIVTGAKSYFAYTGCSSSGISRQSLVVIHTEFCFWNIWHTEDRRQSSCCHSRL